MGLPKYLMPTCPVCQKRYKVPYEQCMIIRFSMKDGSHVTSMHVPSDQMFCKVCKQEVAKRGIKWATKKMLVRVGK